jgi:hypothetical protein
LAYLALGHVHRVLHGRRREQLLVVLVAWQLGIEGYLADHTGFLGGIGPGYHTCSEEAVEDLGRLVRLVVGESHQRIDQDGHLEHQEEAYQLEEEMAYRDHRLEG